MLHRGYLGPFEVTVYTMQMYTVKHEVCMLCRNARGLLVLDARAHRKSRGIATASARCTVPVRGLIFMRQSHRHVVRHTGVIHPSPILGDLDAGDGPRERKTAKGIRHMHIRQLIRKPK